MRRLSVGLLVAALCAASLQADPRRIDPKAYLEHVKFLASDDLEGRGNGGPGLESSGRIHRREIPGGRPRARGRWRHVLSALRDDDRDVGRAGQLGDAAVGSKLGAVRRGPRLRDRVDVGRRGCRPPRPCQWSSPVTVFPRRRFVTTTTPESTPPAKPCSFSRTSRRRTTREARSKDRRTRCIRR